MCCSFPRCLANQLQLEGLEVEAESSHGLFRRSTLIYSAGKRLERLSLSWSMTATCLNPLLAHGSWTTDCLRERDCESSLRLSAGAIERRFHSARGPRPSGLCRSRLPLCPFPQRLPWQGVSPRYAANILASGDCRRTDGTHLSRVRRSLRAVAACIASRWSGHERIALLCSHDWRMPVAVAAVLRAAKTYVPLDPRAPV